ncbi:MAG: PRTRC system protein E [Burkholderiales bacterium]|nr:PRTRC system protein E [Burkholderiales bacterium]
MKLAQQTDFTMAFHATGADKARLSIVLMPVAKEGQDAALSHPVKLEGTVDEIEAGFENAMAKYATARANLTEQLDATLTLLDAAQKSSAAKAAEGLKGKTKTPAKAPGVKPAATTADPLESDDHDEDTVVDDEGGEGPATAAPAAAPAPAALATGNLFGA